jgi:hypothetical protein
MWHASPTGAVDLAYNCMYDYMCSSTAHWVSSLGQLIGSAHWVSSLGQLIGSLRKSSIKGHTGKAAHWWCILQQVWKTHQLHSFPILCVREEPLTSSLETWTELYSNHQLTSAQMSSIGTWSQLFHAPLKQIASTIHRDSCFREPNLWPERQSTQTADFNVEIICLV